MKKKTGRPTTYEQTPERVYQNTRRNLLYKLQNEHITQIEYIDLLSKAKIKMITEIQKNGFENN